jgi:hypothetical protein
MLDVIDETFVVADPADVAAALRLPEVWARLFPGVTLTVFEDRGDAGLRFAVTGRVVGSSEFWVEPWGDGAIVHYYLRADLPGASFEGLSGAAARRLARRAIAERTAHCAGLKAGLNQLKDTLEVGRAPGTPRIPTGR